MNNRSDRYYFFKACLWIFKLAYPFLASFLTFMIVIKFLHPQSSTIFHLSFSFVMSVCAGVVWHNAVIIAKQAYKKIVKFGQRLEEEEG